MPDELLDVYDEQGRHLGVKPRAAVHRDGDWHRAFHLWVVSAEGVLLQRRAPTKAAWPGRLDATAAGHLVAGEDVGDGLREAEEELGIAYALAALVPLGAHRVDDAIGGGGRNREVQHVFAVRDDRSLDAYTQLDAAEVSGLVLVGHDAFAALVSDRAARVPATGWDGRSTAAVRIAAAELVPSPYLPAIAAALLRAATAPPP
ncbi:MAG TPA: NUDIX domain-containing protein [Baekduia sp.]|nr:NUDIX domain-containing protein [Baekduia sp.]